MAKNGFIFYKFLTIGRKRTKIGCSLPILIVYLENRDPLSIKRKKRLETTRFKAFFVKKVKIWRVFLNTFVKCFEEKATIRLNYVTALFYQNETMLLKSSAVVDTQQINTDG